MSEMRAGHGEQWTWRQISSESGKSIYTGEVETQIIREGSIISLQVGGAEQSRIDIERPERLEFEYMQHMNAALLGAFPEPKPIKAAHIGGGICALAWAWEALRPGSRQQAFEMDADIARAAREEVPLPRKPLLRIRVADGREALQRSHASFDVVVRDAFNGTEVPPLLQTKEWSRIVAERTEGLYLANAPHGRGADARRDVAGIKQAFSNVALIADAKVLKGQRLGNIVVAAWHEQELLDTQRIQTLLRRLPLPATFFAHEQVDRWLAGARALSDPEGSQFEDLTPKA